jgi:hypothetical protein
VEEPVARLDVVAPLGDVAGDERAAVRREGERVVDGLSDAGGDGRVTAAGYLGSELGAELAAAEAIAAAFEAVDFTRPRWAV